MKAHIHNCLESPKWAQIWRKLKPVFEAINAEFFIAGGIVRAHFSEEKTKDIDLFFATEEDKNVGYACLIERGGIETEKKGSSTKVWVPAEAIGLDAFGDNVVLDLVYRQDRATVNDALEQFDFTVCCAAVTRAAVAWSHPRFADDVEKRVLRYNNWPQPASNIAHLARLAAKGYTIDYEEACKIVLAIKGREFDPERFNIEEWECDLGSPNGS